LVVAVWDADDDRVIIRVRRGEDDAACRLTGVCGAVGRKDGIFSSVVKWGVGGIGVCSVGVRQIEVFWQGGLPWGGCVYMGRWAKCMAYCGVAVGEKWVSSGDNGGSVVEREVCRRDKVGERVYGSVARFRVVKSLERCDM
jgi:hypothetical protein